MLRYLVLIILPIFLFAQDMMVKITKDIPYVKINDSGVEVTIKRIQDTSNRLTDDFTKTSRPCPPFCISKIKMDGVKTIAELELIDFIQNKVKSKKGILVDARLKKLYELETIPGAINIPFTVVEIDSKKVQDKLFQALGAKIKPDGSYDFTNAKDIAVFCNGLWCEQSTMFLKGIIKHGYPKDKLFWYRDGMQAWKLLGLTTVVHKAIEAK